MASSAAQRRAPVRAARVGGFGGGGGGGQVLGHVRHPARQPGRAAVSQTCSAYAEQLELDVEKFESALRSHKYADRITEDVVSADESGVTGTPTFFINGRRHWGVYDLDTLTREVNAAKVRVRLVQKAGAQDDSGEPVETAGVAPDGQGDDRPGEPGA